MRGSFPWRSNGSLFLSRPGCPCRGEDRRTVGAVNRLYAQLSPRGDIPVGLNLVTTVLFCKRKKSGDGVLLHETENRAGVRPNRDARAPENAMAKNIVFCADGTWDASANSTNVYKLFKACLTTATQVPYYDDGVGSDGTPVDRLLGGAFG